MFASTLVMASAGAYAQTSTSASPYSQFGIGQMREDLLPQNRAMGGLSTALRTLNGVYTTNPGNPASYSAARYSTFDIGLYGNGTQLQKGQRSDHTADFAFSHITMTFPMKKLGGVSFGLLPFSDVGYNSTTTNKLDSISYKKVFSGEGGLSKAYLGWGVNVLKNLSIGANVSYIFGTLYDYSRIEFPYNYSALNSQQQDKREITGMGLDYGLQYTKVLGKEYVLTLGYTGSLNNSLHDKTSSYMTRIEPSLDESNQNIALDTVNTIENNRRDLTLPLKHSAGFHFGRLNHWQVGAEYKFADWSNFQVRTGENKLRKNQGIAVGGQFIPDVTSLSYWKNVEYRVGYRYNQTQYYVNQQSLKDMAVTFGFGLPLSRNQFSGAFSKFNISAELGQMGSINNNLIRERYVNINLGFTLNDRWFRRNQLD